MENKTGKTSRRGFLVGMAAGLGTAAAAVSSAGKVKAKGLAPEQKASGPVLYRRTAETERYYKTLYT